MWTLGSNVNPSKRGGRIAAPGAMARIFLSYRSLDRGAATALEGTATQAGHRVFLDCLPEGGIPAGDDWEHRLYDELYRSGALVALVSASYVQSQWCFAELAIARARGLFILPIALEAGLRHPLLANVQHLDVGGDLSTIGERLLSRLRDLEGISAVGWSSDRPLCRRPRTVRRRRRRRLLRPVAGDGEPPGNRRLIDDACAPPASGRDWRIRLRQVVGSEGRPHPGAPPSRRVAQRASDDPGGIADRRLGAGGHARLQRPRSRRLRHGEPEAP